jgi:hypothetical protein
MEETVSGSASNRRAGSSAEIFIVAVIACFESGFANTLHPASTACHPRMAPAAAYTETMQNSASNARNAVYTACSGLGQHECMNTASAIASAVPSGSPGKAATPC